MPALDADELNAILREGFPHERAPAEVVAVSDEGVRMLLRFDASQVRPGGTLSGPTVMTLADAAAWMLTLSQVGAEPRAVTAGLSVQFLARPEPDDLLAEARLLHLGRRQAVSEVRLVDRGGAGRLVAFATVVYALPG